jgi:hypothetical protein
LTRKQLKCGIAALPVFDCVVVKASTEVVKKIMQQEFKPVAGLI